jgi:hypothetical protein
VAGLGDETFGGGDSDVPGRHSRRDARAAWQAGVVDRMVVRRRVAAVAVAVAVAHRTGGLLPAINPVVPLDVGVSFLSALPAPAATAMSAQHGFSRGILPPMVVLVVSRDVVAEQAALARLGDRFGAGFRGGLSAGRGSQPSPVAAAAPS